MKTVIGSKIYYFDTIDSTNNKAKQLAMDEAEGTVIVADEQFMGKGRYGKDWTSSKGKGIYMSIILKPEIDPEKVSRITLIGAAAVNKALSEMGITSQIKWPNDIVIEGKKVCGILTEMSCDSNMINYVIMGIGINVNLDKEDIPLELMDRATSIKLVVRKEINREMLLSSILINFEVLYLQFKNKGNISNTIEICKTHSAVLGKEVQIINGDQIRIGRAIDINKDGELVVEFDTGIEIIISGEISIRGIDGYI